MSAQPKPRKGERRQAFWHRIDLRRDGGRILLVLVAILAVNFACWWAFVKPLEDDISAMEQQKLSADMTERSSVQRLEQIRSVHAHVGEVEEGVRRFFDEMLSVRAKRWVPFQRAVRQVAKDFKVEPRRGAIDYEALEKEGIEVFRTSFPLSGGYENLRNFLARLEGLDQFLIVRSVSLRSAKQGGRDLQLDIGIETYFNDPELRDEIERERKWAAEQRARKRRSKSGRR